MRVKRPDHESGGEPMGASLGAQQQNPLCKYCCSTDSISIDSCGMLKKRRKIVCIYVMYVCIRRPSVSVGTKGCGKRERAGVRSTAPRPPRPNTRGRTGWCLSTKNTRTKSGRRRAVLVAATSGSPPFDVSAAVSTARGLDARGGGGNGEDRRETKSDQQSINGTCVERLWGENIHQD